MAFSLQSLEKSMWAIVLALLMLCGGMGMVVVVYMWLAWYAAVHTERERRRSADKRSGLSKSDILKLPTFIHHEGKKDANNGEGDEVMKKKKSGDDELCVSGDLECTVCLEQFEEGQKCLLIPTCKHCFHLHCADSWLSKSPICPVCRASAYPENHQPDCSCNNDNTPNHATISDSRVVDIPD